MKAAILLFLCITLSCATRANADDDAIINRRINRLDTHISFLTKFHTKNKEQLKSLIKEVKHALWQFDITDYEHDLIRLCIKKVTNKHALDPVFETWRLFLNAYRDIDAPRFLREFSVLIFCVYKNLIVSLIKPDHKVTSTDIFELSSKIMSLPIDQVLDALDMCYRQFMFIMQDYGMTTASSPAEWIKQYWWVIPVSVVSLIVSVAKFVVMRPFWGPSYNIPRKEKEISMICKDEQPSEEKSVDDFFKTKPYVIVKRRIFLPADANSKVLWYTKDAIW